MDKKIRSKVVRESLLDYETLANSLKENTKDAIKSMLDETVRQEYAKLLTEGEDYDEEEVDDTEGDTNVDDAAVSEVNPSDEGKDPVGDDAEVEADVESDGADTDVDVSIEGEDEEGNKWAEFDKYKVSDGEYDFSNAEDDEIVKVYKLMNDEDQILVNKDDNGMVNVKDNTTGAEYLIDMDNDSSIEDEGDGFGMEDDFDLNVEDEDMNESTNKMFELIMEYDSNVGYTDNYQKKDVMTSPGMSEPSKGTNDWDKGVPHGTEKPWSGYPSKKNKADKPFNAGKGKQVEEQVDECGDIELEEGAGRNGKVQIHSRSKKHIGTNPIENANLKVQHSNSNSEDGYMVDNSMKESTMKKINKALSENKALKESLTNVMTSLKEAAVTNHNLAQIIKLISENATTKEEKDEIVKRFMKEAKTVDASRNLYESLSNDLKKKNTMSINEEKSFNVEGTKKLNETTIYKSKDLLESLDLMSRVMKC